MTCYTLGSEDALFLLVLVAFSFGAGFVSAFAVMSRALGGTDATD